jgi:hypothetical protein
MSGKDKSNVFVLKDERRRRQKQVRLEPEAKQKPKARPKQKKKRGRPPKRSIRTFYRLVSEVEAVIDEIRKKKPHLKRKPLKEAIARCLRHDNETQPRSWWWGQDGVPLKYRSAAQLYDDALEVIEASEAMVAKEGPDDWHLPSLASLGADLPKPAQPSYRQIFEEMLRDKRELYRAGAPSAMLLAQKRDFQGRELRTIAVFKGIATKMHMALAVEAPRRPPGQVERLRAFVKKFDRQLADFEISLGKIGAVVPNFPSQK